MKKELFKKIVHIVNLSLFFAIVIFMFCDVSDKITIFGRNFSISFWLSLIALPLFIISYFFIYKSKELNRLAIVVFLLFLILFVSSFTSALILTPNYYQFGSIAPTIVIAKESAKYIFDILVFFYLLFFVKFISKKQIDIIFYSFMAAWLLVAGLQLIVYYKPNSGFAKFYDAIDFLGILVNSATIDKARYEGFRLYSFLSEPSVNCMFLCGFILPFLFYKILSNRNNKTIVIINSVLFVLFFAGAFFTKSSAVYVSLFAYVIATIFVSINYFNFSRKTIIIVAVSIFATIVMLFIIPFTRNLILYYAIDKILNINNLSTAYRYSTVYNDLLVFIKMPLFGCGDGLQGLFYFEHISGTQLTISYETVNSLTFKQGLLNGGALIPSIISGFGIFGCFIIAFLLKKHFSYIKSSLVKKDMKIFWIAYLPAIISILVTLTVAIGIHRNYPLLFFVVLPFCVIGEYKINPLNRYLIIFEKKYYSVTI